MPGSRNAPRAFLAALLLQALLSPPAVAVGSATVITITVDYTGGSPAVMDTAFATPLNRAISQLPGVNRLESTSQEGRCSIVVAFDPKVDDQAAAQNVGEAVNRSLAVLPRDSQPLLRIVRGDPELLPAVWGILTSKSETQLALSTTARRFVGEPMARAAGVAEIRYFGHSTENVQLDLDPERMAAFGVTPAEVTQTIQEASRGPNNDKTNAKALAMLDDAIVKVVNGTPVRVKDIGRINRLTQTRGFALCDKLPVPMVAIALRPESRGADDAVQKELGRLAQKLPQSMQLQTPVDLSRDRALLIELRPPAGAQPEAYRQIAERVSDTVHAAAPRSTCIVFWPGGVEPIRVLARGDGLDAASPAWNRLRDGTPELDIRTCEVGGPAGLRPFPVRIALVGRDPVVLQKWADAVDARLASEKAVAGVVTFPGRGVPYLKFEIDRDLVAKLGLAIHDVEEMAVLLSGEPRPVETTGDHPLEIRLKGPASPADRLAGFTVRSAKGELVPLSTVVKATQAMESSAIVRRGQSQAIQITANPPPGTTLAAATARCLAVAAAERERLNIPREFEAVDTTVEQK